MSCDRCRGLSVEYPIVISGDLRQVLKIIGTDIADGTLRVCTLDDADWR